MDRSAIDVVTALHKALESGVHGEALGELFAPGAVFVEHPNLVTPKGATRGANEALEGSKSGAQLLAWQRYELRDAIEQGELVVARVTWTAEIGRDRGPFRAGQRLTAHLAQFITVREGRIARLETYDCYEPFPAAPAAG